MSNSVLKVMLALEEIGVITQEMPKQANGCLSIARGRIVGCNSSRFETSASKCTALMHEHGHFKSGAFYMPYSPYVVMEQAENKADKAAILMYLPKNEIDYCVKKGITELWELAEYFNVTEDFMQKAMLYYKEKEYD